MWLIFAVLAGVFSTAENLLQRFHLRKQKDVWTFAFFYSLTGTMISLPLMLSSPTIPHDPHIWLLAALVGLLIVGNNLLIFKASGLIEMSIINSLLKLRLVWVFLLGILFLSNPFSWPKFIGTLLAIAAGLIILHNFKRPRTSAGFSLVLTASLFNAGIVVLSKYLLGSFNVVSLTFFVSFLPATIFIFLVMPHAISRIKNLFKTDWKIVFLACAFGTFTNLTLNAALNLHDVASVLVINEAFLVLVLVGEHAYLKEREQVWVKVASVLLAVTGAILIDISH